MDLVIIQGQPKKSSVSNIMRDIAKKNYGKIIKQKTPYKELEIKYFQCEKGSFYLMFVDNREQQISKIPIRRFGNFWEFHIIKEHELNNSLVIGA